MKQTRQFSGNSGLLNFIISNHIKKQITDSHIKRCCYGYLKFKGTTNTTHYGVSKFLTNLLNPLAKDEYTVKDSFEAANMIHKIPPELFHRGYRYFSFDVT